MLGCVMLQSGQIQFVPSRATQAFAKRELAVWGGVAAGTVYPLDPICSSCLEAFRISRHDPSSVFLPSILFFAINLYIFNMEGQ